RRGRQKQARVRPLLRAAPVALPRPGHLLPHRQDRPLREGRAMSVAVKLREEELRVEVLPGRDAFCSLEREWNAALAKGPRDEPMLRHEWTRAFIENFAPGATLRTFVARAGRELHAALPLIESRDRAADTCFLPMTTWAMPSNDHSQRGGMLLGRRSEEGLRAIWEQLMDTPGWDRLRLRD